MGDDKAHYAFQRLRLGSPYRRSPSMELQQPPKRPKISLIDDSDDEYSQPAYPTSPSRLFVSHVGADEASENTQPEAQDDEDFVLRPPRHLPTPGRSGSGRGKRAPLMPAAVNPFAAEFDTPVPMDDDTPLRAPTVQCGALAPTPATGSVVSPMSLTTTPRPSRHSIGGGGDTTTPRSSVRATPATPVKGVSRRPFGWADTSGDEDDDDDGLGMSNGNCGKAQASRFDEDFELLGDIGHGSFGTVMRVKKRLDGCFYAVKRSRQRLRGAAHLERMLQEVYALAALCNEDEVPHVVRYFSAWVEDDHLYIQTELCECSLDDLVRKHNFPTSGEEVLQVARDILLGLQQLHSHNMVHLDIKPANIFRKHGHYKIGDFGLATLAGTRGADVLEGDSRYLPRELLQECAADLPKCDIFSLGATLYELCLGRPLPPNGPEWNDIRNGALQPLPHVDASIVELIQNMMHPQPSLRPSASLLLRHQLLRSRAEVELEGARACAERNQAIAESYKHDLLKQLQKDNIRLTRSYTM